MLYFIKNLYLLTFIFTSFITFSQTFEESEFNCFSILVAKEATVDGSVMLAHNEDDWGDRVVNWYTVPRETHHLQKDSIQLKRGHKIAQVQNTNSYLWLEIPELEFSDSYINEYGIVITSDACRSREDKPELVNGGIGYWLRRLLIERAKTAREAVEIAGKLVETIGYVSSGRTYCIADSQETWMLSVVQGKHWVAQRIPDKHVAIIPNYYTITSVDLTDSANFLGSKDLIEYAVKREWYNPETDGAFNFRKAYSNQNNLQNIGNKARLWVSINSLSRKQYAIDDEFPFSFVPKKKLALEDLFSVLRNHYEGTELKLSNKNKTTNPHHQKIMSVCSSTNQYGFVAQLRNWMPSVVGNVLWIAPKRPCTQAFIPIYSGISSLPYQLAVSDFKTALAEHFIKIDDFKAYSKEHRYLLFDKKAKQIDENYEFLIGKQQKRILKFEKKLLKRQHRFEKKISKCYRNNQKSAKKRVSNYSKKQLERAIKNTQ